MITFLTGAPGGGKTLYTVWNLLRRLIGTSVFEELDDGTQVEHKRIIYTNIRGLLLDHELVDAERMKTWHEWCKPGDMFVFDEVQKVWPPRPNGAVVPKHISELEEHRGVHSVDFIIISQHPLLVDRNVLALVGRHLHLRRISLLPLSICYEWDMVSRTLAFKNSTSKQFIRFNRAAYKLYKSARVHTKQPKKIPSLVYVVLLAVAAAAWKIPESYGRIIGKGDQVKLAAAGKNAPGSKTTVSVTQGPPPGEPPPPGAPLPSATALVQIAVPELVGCARLREICRCYDQAARVLERPFAFCQAQTTVPVAPGGGSLDQVPDLGASKSLALDLDMIEWTTRQRKIAVAYR